VLTEDGETGGWNESDGCIFSLSFPVIINAAGVQLPDEDIGPICQNECVVIDAGSGCDDYSWSNGDSGSEITVCPSVTTTYTVTVSSDAGCATSGEITVLVEPCCDADVGILTANPLALCPGETSIISVSNYQDDPAYNQVMIQVDENGIIQEITEEDILELTSAVCQTYTIYAYNYLISSDAVVPSIGQNITAINCETSCCELIEIEVSFEDNEPPTFNNPPSNITIECIEDLPSLEELSWTDNCLAQGSSAGNENQNFSFCAGGEVVRTWTAIDNCENETNYTQTITILPINEASFIQTPENTTISCTEEIPEGINLEYSNSQSGSCLINGSAIPTVVIDTTICGGTITYSWEFTDECERTITHQQVVTLDPPPTPQFIDPPSDITINCGDEIGNAVDLIVSNYQTGRCKIETSISPMIENQTEVCGGSIVNTWEYTDNCGNDISHTQTVTIVPAQEAVFIDPPSDITISCDEYEENIIFLEFSNNETGHCNISGTVEGIIIGDPEICGNVIRQVWFYTDDCGRVIDYTQEINIIPSLAPYFIDLPESDISISCGESHLSSPLSYINGMQGACEISGTVDGVINGTFDACGGQMEQTWNFTDECGNSISYLQTIEVLPAPDPMWIDLPNDLTINCDEELPAPATIEYNNNEDGNCAIQGYVNANVSQNESTVAYTWIYINECNGNEISHTQTITTCLETCSIQSNIVDIYCSNNNTSSDEEDDTFTADISTVISEGSGSYIIEPGGYQGSSGELITVGPFDISDGEVILTISDAIIASCTTTLTIQTPSPCSTCEETVDAGTGGTLDCQNKSIILEGTSSTSGIGHWTDPSGTVQEGYEITADLGGTYYFSVDFGEGCIFTDSLIVSVSNEIPTANAGPDKMLTCDIDTVILQGTISGGGENLAFAWYNENGILLSNDLELEVTVAGNYYFEVKDLDTDCISPQDVTSVTDETNGPLAIIYTDPGEILDCIVELIYITNEIEQNVTYSWMIDNQPTNIPNPSIDEPADITLIAIDTITGCSADAHLTILSLEEYPIVNMISSGVLSCENEEIIINGSTSQFGDNISYTWYNVNNETIATGVEQITVSEPGIYYLELMDIENSCTNIDTIEIEGTYNYPIITSNEDYAFGCSQDELHLSVAINGSSEHLEYKWKTIDGNITSGTDDAICIVDLPGTYTVAVIDPNSGCISMDTITVLPAEEIESTDIAVYDESCDQSTNGEFILETINGGTPPYTFIFGDLVQNNNVVDGLTAGTYHLSIVDVNGCRFDTSVIISTLPPFHLDLDPDIRIQQGSTTTLFVDVDIPDSDIAKVSWSPSYGLSCDTCLVTELDGSLSVEEYTVTVTDIYGCENESTVRIDKEETTKINIPNIISNNGDRSNDAFTVYSDDPNAEILSMKIFDRWGELVFTKESFLPNIPSEGWDGTFKAQNVAQGVYVYLVELDLVEGKKTFSGDVTVVR